METAVPPSAPGPDVDARSATSGGAATSGGSVGAATSGGSVGAVSTLRGAAVDVNARLVARVAVTTCAAALLATVAVLTVAGLHRNAQITALRSHGVAVEVHATSCIGLMGGSGSNLAGYRCEGSFVLNGRRYTDTIPDGVLHRPGSTVRAVTVRSDPALLATVGQVATDRPSLRVFLLPGALLGALVLVGIALLAVRRRSGTVGGPMPGVTAGGADLG